MFPNYEVNPEKANYLKQELVKRYPEIFEKYEMEDLSKWQVCNLADFLEKENLKGENGEEALTKMFAVISIEESKAVLINIDKSGKLPEGEFGIYELENHELHLTNEDIKEKMKESLNRKIMQYAKDIYSVEQIQEMMEAMQPKTLEDMHKMVAKGEQEMDEKAEELVKYTKPDEINEKNGKLKEERKALEQRSRKNRKITVGQESNQKDEPKEVPEDVAKACMKLGVTNIKGYFYVNAKQLDDKVEHLTVNENGGKVLIIEIANSSNLAGPNRYFGMQEDKMVLYGTQDKEIEEVTQKSAVAPMDGKLVEPLKKHNPTYVEFSDSAGMVIEEKLEENMNLSVQDLENYKKEVEKLLEQYSKNVVAIEENGLLSEKSKMEMLLENNQNFNRLNIELAQKFGIDFQNVQEINWQKAEYTGEVLEEIAEDDEPDAHEQWWRNQRRNKPN